MPQSTGEARSVTCIRCPVGCRVSVTLQSGEIATVQGNQCGLGESYARQECICPKRVVTAVAPVAGSAMPVSLKTESAIPREKIGACMRAIHSLKLHLPIRAGEVLLYNVADTGVNLVATKSLG